eukprot:1140833-Amphidinium_carterae.1
MRSKNQSSETNAGPDIKALPRFKQLLTNIRWNGLLQPKQNCFVNVILSWALPLMLCMSPPLSTFDGRVLPKRFVISGFWWDRSSENVRKLGH